MRPRPETCTSDDARRMERIRSSQPDPEMIFAERETFQFIIETLGKFKPTLRHAFTMTYFDEMSVAEARALLGVSTAAFKSRLLRARRQLLNLIQRIRATRICSDTILRRQKSFSAPCRETAGDRVVGSLALMTVPLKSMAMDKPEWLTSMETVLESAWMDCSTSSKSFGPTSIILFHGKH